MSLAGIRNSNKNKRKRDDDGDDFHGKPKRPRDRSKMLNRSVPQRLFGDTKQKDTLNKSTIRSLKRLLTKPDLSEEIRAAKSIELKILTDQLVEKEKQAKIDKIEKKYKMVKFIEKQKCQRRLKSLTRRLATIRTSDRGVTAEEKELREQIERVKKDVDYIDYYPKGVKYIALFAKQQDGDDSDSDHDDSADDKQRPASRAKASADGLLVMSEEDDAGDSDNADDNDSDDEHVSEAPRSAGKHAKPIFPIKPASAAVPIAESADPREAIRAMITKNKARREADEKKANIAHTGAGSKKEKRRKEFKDAFFQHSDSENEKDAAKNNNGKESKKQSAKPAANGRKRVRDNEASNERQPQQQPRGGAQSHDRLAKPFAHTDRNQQREPFPKQNRRVRLEASSEKQQTNDIPMAATDNGAEELVPPSAPVRDRNARRAEQARQHRAETSDDHSVTFTVESDSVSAKPDRKARRAERARQHRAEANGEPSATVPVVKAEAQVEESDCAKPDRKARRAERARLHREQQASQPVPDATTAPSANPKRQRHEEQQKPSHKSPPVDAAAVDSTEGDQPSSSTKRRKRSKKLKTVTDASGAIETNAATAGKNLPVAGEDRKQPKVDLAALLQLNSNNDDD